MDKMTNLTWVVYGKDIHQFKDKKAAIVWNLFYKNAIYFASLSKALSIAKK